MTGVGGSRGRVSPWMMVLCLWCTTCATSQTAPPGTQAAEPRAGKGTLERLNAVLWMQSAAEYRVLAEWVYRTATERLPRLRDESSVTAVTEQRAGFEALPPAVILDIDETVLDNSPFQASLIQEGVPYSEARFAEWVRLKQAAPVPGAAEFIRECAAMDIMTFFVTNRDASLEEDTRANLAQAGILPEGSTFDRILSKGEQEPGGKAKWESDKTGRRAYLASQYRVIMLVGDDLGDFVSGHTQAPEARLAVADPKRRPWGTTWFLLPNAIYGSWETATYGNDMSLSPEQVLERKRAALCLSREGCETP